jgi:UPF0755 protein
MSNLGLQLEPGSAAPRGPRHRGLSWLAVVLSLVVLVGIGFVVKVGLDNLPTLGSGPADYEGEGTEPAIVVTVEKGDTLAKIGQTLKSEGVVASVDAWLDAAKRESEAKSIGPGQYEMLTRMSAAAAVQRMVDPNTRVVNELLLREGLRMDQTFEVIKQATGIPIKELEQASESGEIGLPKYAKDFAEGFLFPAKYELGADDTATDILSRLVKRWDQAAAKVDLEQGAAKLGRTPYEIMIIASLVQAEGHPDDFDKVARVIYNRLDESTWGGTYGLLQMDATLNYALKKSDINLTTEELQNTDSPYNTYKNPGLPPTPINSPGEAAMAAALNPADGDWLYYVTVNPESGETKFTNDYNEFLTFKQELSTWLDENPQ